jgi:DNA-binding NarL/FixJ family response regulator
MLSVRVLVVDDVECWRLFVSSVLREEPLFEVICMVSDGLKAVRMAGKLQPAVVLLDIGLPGLNGIEAGGWIHKLAPDVKLVFVSQQCDPDIARAALRLEGSAYVLKSDAGRELVAAIHSVVRGKTYVSQGLADYGLLDGA